MKRQICLIAAMANNNIIGNNGKIPWPKLPGDMKRFVNFTMNNPVIMGRKTYESIGQPLVYRQNIIVSRNPRFRALGVSVTESLEEALEVAISKNPGREIWVIGGGEIYSQTMYVANRLEITEINADYAGDTKFPQIKKDDWEEISRETFNEPNYPVFSFVSYVRKRK